MLIVFSIELFSLFPTQQRHSNILKVISNKVEVFESAYASHQQPAGRRDFDAHTLHTHIMMRG
jgi:hypothetical protein